MKYPIVIEKANRNYSAYCPDPPGCVAAGVTVEETKRNMEEAVELHIEGLKRMNYLYKNLLQRLLI